MKTIITVNNLSKKYRFGLKPHSSLRIFKPRKYIGDGLKEDEFWALRHVSFAVNQGEVLGIIGPNGAGKSTLLKILSRITPPTEGEMILRGRLASLLEVGTGFQPELTGRENIFLNGALLGMKRAEIKKKFSEIVAFSEIEKFLDTPVKHYSSGMYVRLAFAIAAHLEPEILLVDEVLAVGDAAFQKKCLGKMKNVSINGTTVLFVSHNMETIENLCSRCLMIENGSITMSGNVDAVIQMYIGRNSKNSSRTLKCGPLTLTLDIVSRENEHKNTFRLGEQMLIKANICSEVPFTNGDFGVGIEDVFGIRICTFHTQYQLKKKISFQKKCDITIDWKEIIIVPGLYKLVAAFYEKGELVAHWDNLSELNIVAADYFNTGKLPNPSHQGKVVVNSVWNIKEY